MKTPNPNFFQENAFFFEQAEMKKKYDLLEGFPNGPTDRTFDGLLIGTNFFLMALQLAFQRINGQLYRGLESFVRFTDK